MIERRVNAWMKVKKSPGAGLLGALLLCSPRPVRLIDCAPSSAHAGARGFGARVRGVVGHRIPVLSAGAHAAGGTAQPMLSRCSRCVDDGLALAGPVRRGRGRCGARDRAAAPVAQGSRCWSDELSAGAARVVTSGLCRRPSRLVRPHSPVPFGVHPRLDVGVDQLVVR